MADDLAVANLVGSVRLLINATATLKARLDALSFETSAIPEPFASLVNVLSTVKFSFLSIEHQARAGRASANSIGALQTVVQNISSQLSVLHASLLPNYTSTDVLQLLRDQNRARQVRTTIEQICQNNQILEALVKTPSNDASSHGQRGQHYGNATLDGHASAIFGNVYNYGMSHNQYQEPHKVPEFGLCLRSAPRIDPRQFIGRAAELEQIHQILQPGTQSTEQQRVVLGGMGGVGKTQLAIAYARRYQPYYSSIFWLNASSILTLKASFRTMAQRLFSAPELEKLTEEQTAARVFDWLSNVRNLRWLLVFDNYDDPDQFTIDSYCPDTRHSSLIITTRLPNQVSGSQIRLQPLSVIEECINVLESRSGRSRIKDDPAACQLVERLGGLPLALTTVGAHLSKSTLTFQQYLQEYDRCWRIDAQRPLRLQEYHSDQTLYTAWNLSYTRLQGDDPLAAKMLKLLAYFDNQDVWYELLFAGVSDDLPKWLQELTSTRRNFDSLMGALVDYCLVEPHSETQSFSIHHCVHAWTMTELNETVDPQLCWYAFECIANSVERQTKNTSGRTSFPRLVRHALRLVQYHFFENEHTDLVWQDRLQKTQFLGYLFIEHAQYPAAAHTYQIVLHGIESSTNPDHELSLLSMYNLSIVYFKQGKPDEAEQISNQALAMAEKTLGQNHPRTLKALSQLGLLYAARGDLCRAEYVHEQAIARSKEALGSDHLSTLRLIHHVCNVYRQQGRLEKAELMLEQALTKVEECLGCDHILTINMVQDLGVVYWYQGQLEKAEQMYDRALAGYTKVLGRDHESTWYTLECFGLLYCDRGNLGKAEKMFEYVCSKKVEAFGHNHHQTLRSVRLISTIYVLQGKIEKAKQNISSARTSYETLFRDCSFVRQTVVRDYADILELGIWISGWSSQNARKLIVELIDHFDRRANKDICVTICLTRALLIFSDQKNAIQAIACLIQNIQGQIWDFGGEQCNGCFQRLNTDKGLRICQSCVATNLCDRCMFKYATNTITLRMCQHDHEFFNFNKAISQARQSLENRDCITTDAWIEALKAQYWA